MNDRQTSKDQNICKSQAMIVVAKEPGSSKGSMVTKISSYVVKQPLTRNQSCRIFEYGCIMMLERHLSFEGETGSGINDLDLLLAMLSSV